MGGGKYNSTQSRRVTNAQNTMKSALSTAHHQQWTRLEPLRECDLKQMLFNLIWFILIIIIAHPHLIPSSPRSSSSVSPASRSAVPASWSLFPSPSLSPATPLQSFPLISPFIPVSLSIGGTPPQGLPLFPAFPCTSSPFCGAVQPASCSSLSMYPFPFLILLVLPPEPEAECFDRFKQPLFLFQFL